MKCAFCGFDDPADENYCSECGKPRVTTNVWADLDSTATPKPASPGLAPVTPKPVAPARPADSRHARLVGLDGPVENLEFALDHAETRIGRQPDCDIALADENVSRVHALIRRSPTGFEIVDMGSANGTWLNGVKLAEPRPLTDRDIIRIGQSNFAVHFDAPAPAPPAPRGAVTIMAEPGEGPGPFVTGVVPILSQPRPPSVTPPDTLPVTSAPWAPTPVNPPVRPAEVVPPRVNSIPSTPLQQGGGDLPAELARLREHLDPFIAELSQFSRRLDALDTPLPTARDADDREWRAVVDEFINHLEAYGGEEKYRAVEDLLDEVRTSSTDIRLLMRLSDELPSILHLVEGYLKLIDALKLQDLQ